MPWIPKCLPIFHYTWDLTRTSWSLANQPGILGSLWKKKVLINDQQAVFREDTRKNKPPTCFPPYPLDELQTSKLSVKGQLWAISGCALCSSHLAPQL